MRPFIVLSCFALALGLSALGAYGQGTGGAKKGGDAKDKSKSLPPSKKTADPKAPPKGSAVLLASSFPKGAAAKNNKPPSQTSQKYAMVLKQSVTSGNLTLNAGQSAALGKLLAQQPLTYDDRQTLSDLLFQGSAAGLTSEDEAALSYLLTYYSARNPESDSAKVAPAVSGAGPLPIRVVNRTKEKIKAWIQIVARTPSEAVSKPNAAPETLKQEMEPSKAYDLQRSNKERVTASVIRIWALSPTRQWVKNRDQDLPVTANGTSKLFVVSFTDSAK